MIYYQPPTYPNLLDILLSDLDFLFHMFFLARYCKLLEQNSFSGRTIDFFYMLLFGATVLTGIVLIGGMIPYVSESFAKVIFLSNSLTFMMVSFPLLHIKMFLSRVNLLLINGFWNCYFLHYIGLCEEQAKSNSNVEAQVFLLLFACICW